LGKLFKAIPTSRLAADCPIDVTPRDRLISGQVLAWKSRVLPRRIAGGSRTRHFTTYRGKHFLPRLLGSVERHFLIAQENDGANLLYDEIVPCSNYSMKNAQFFMRNSLKISRNSKECFRKKKERKKEEREREREEKKKKKRKRAIFGAVRRE